MINNIIEFPPQHPAKTQTFNFLDEVRAGIEAALSDLAREQGMSDLQIRAFAIKGFQTILQGKVKVNPGFRSVGPLENKNFSGITYKNIQYTAISALMIFSNSNRF